jgi:type II secretory pathway pseudopilin PulG
MTTTTIRSQRGYTVAEVLIVAAIIGFIMSGLFVMLRSGQQSYVAGSGRAEAQQNARLAIDRMIYELRTAGYDPTRATGFIAVTALSTGTGFVIKNDWNANGTIDTNVTQTVDGVSHGEQVTYTFSGTTLTRQESNIDGSAVTVTDKVSNVSLQYLDEAGNTVSNPSGTNASLIRTVVIDITTSPDTTATGTATQANVRSRSQVRVRNR